jgi:hypothetical protein
LASEVTDRARAIEVARVAATVVAEPDASVYDLEVAAAVLWAGALRLLVYVTGNLTYSCSPAGPPPSNCRDYLGIVANGPI